MAIKISKYPDLQAKYPDEFVNQCDCLKNICPKCGSRFGSGIVLECPSCGEKRPRCQNRKMTNSDTCRTHAHGRPYTLYTKLAGHISDAALEEFIERENDMDLTQEFALARIALSGALDKGDITSSDLMDLLKGFFSIAQRKKRIDEGDILNISWNDELVIALKKRMRNLVLALEKTLKEELDKFPLPEDFDKDFAILNILTKVKQESKLVGNAITSPKQ